MRVPRNKIVLAIAAVLVLATAAIGVASPAVREALGKGISGAFLGMTGGGQPDSEPFVLTKNISLAADLVHEEQLTLDVPADLVIINFTHAGTTWSAGGERLDFEPGAAVSVALHDFNGAIIAGDTLSLAGSTGRIFVNGVAILPDEASLTVGVDDLAFGSVQLVATRLEGLSVGGADGTVAAGGDTAVVKLAGDGLQLGHYLGNITLSPGGLVLDGLTDNVTVSGELLVAIT